MRDDEPGSGPAVPPPPPAGWYPDPRTGAPRWWDGTAWGPAAPQPPRGNSNAALSVLSHLGMFVFGVVVPLVIYLTAGKNDPDVRFHAREALNFQITFLLVWLAGFVVLFITVFGAATVAGGSGPPVGVVVLFLAMFATYALGVGVAIFAAVQAGRGRRWRYPVSIRLVR